jgi:hypothetical protein
LALHIPFSEVNDQLAIDNATVHMKIAHGIIDLFAPRNPENESAKSMYEEVLNGIGETDTKGFEMKLNKNTNFSCTTTLGDNNVFYFVQIAPATVHATPAKAVDFTGNWSTDYGEIIIEKQTATSFNFSFSGWTEEGNTGELEGTAVIKGSNMALYEEKFDFRDEITRVKFTLKNNTLVVEEENTLGLFGVGVYISGTYKKK